MLQPVLDVTTRPQLITWTTHTEESTTLLDYKKLYTTLRYT